MPIFYCRSEFKISMTTYTRPSNTGIQISGNGMRRSLLHRIPPVYGYSPSHATHPFFARLRLVNKRLEIKLRWAASADFAELWPPVRISTPFKVSD